LRRTIQRDIEDVLSEKILFGEFRAGHIVAIDTEGEGTEQKFTYSAHDRTVIEDLPVTVPFGEVPAED